ncbi:MAG: hypothetical protein CBD28_002470 [Rhizobiales bacterium TMED168]|nr:MAG: hypothetical protein CBD28_002470 [Rhizobiales bacterium TMED168]|tara:strand:+ start:16987 stop:17397 length:411 start_codon:yes stop_codon:yes gene_type:complete
MKKISSIILVIFVLAYSNALMAEWSLYGETDNAYHFINLYETSSDDKYVYYWILTDYKNPQKNSVLIDSFLSKKVFKQTDCRRFRTSAAEIIIYSKKMSEGKIIISEKYKESSFSTPNFDSIGYEELEIICNYKNK